MRNTLLFLLLISVSMPLVSQDHAFRIEEIKHLGPFNGITQTANYNHFEDSKGFMWFTAMDYMNRYDGAYIKAYSLKRYYKNCPPLHLSYGICEDDSGNMYFGSKRGIYKYHRKQDYFTLLHPFGETDSSIVVIGYSDGVVWYMNNQWLLASYNIKNNTHAIERQLPFLPLPPMHIYISGYTIFYKMPFIDSKKQLWLFPYLEPTVACFSTITKQLSYPVGHKEQVRCSYYDKTNDQILLGYYHSAIRFSIRDNRKEELNLEGLKQFGSHALASYKNRLTYTDGKHLYVYDTQTNEQIWKEDLKFFNHQAHSLWFDKSGRIWSSSTGFGINIIQVHPKPMYAFPAIADSLSKMLTGGTASFGETPAHHILIHRATLNLETNKVQPAKEPYSALHSHQKTNDYSRKGVWHYLKFVKENTDSMLLFTDANDQVKWIARNPKGSGIKQITDVEILRNGMILLATSKGVHQYNPDTRTLHPITNTVRENAFQLAELRDGIVAVSYLDKPAFLYQLTKNNRLEEMDTILPKLDILYFAYNKTSNSFWAGSNEGLILLDTQYQIQQRFNVNEGLSSDNIYGLLLDDEGNAWCSHGRGISSISKTDYHITNYDLQDGVQNWDFNNCSFMKASDGTLFFGGMTGFNYFKPPLRLHAFYKPRVYIDQIKINQQEYTSELNYDLLQQIELPSNENNLSITASILDLGNADARMVIYRLLGSDTSWKKTTYKTPIELTALGSGTYTLQLGCFDKFSYQFNTQKELVIIILPPFYKTWWFAVLLFLICTSVAAYLIYLTIKRRNRAKFNQLHQQQALERLEMEALKAQINPHFVFNCLSSIKGFIYDQNYLQAETYLDKFSSLLRATLNFSSKQKISLEEEINYIRNYLDLENLRFPEKLQYQLHIDKTIPVKQIQIPAMMLQPLVENAIRHGILNLKDKKGYLTIQFTLNQEYLQVVIDDNGIGREKANYMNPFPSEKHESKGSAIIQRLADLYNIEYKLIDKPQNTGTTVYLNIPL